MAITFSGAFKLVTMARRVLRMLGPYNPAPACLSAEALTPIKSQGDIWPPQLDGRWSLVPALERPRGWARRAFGATAKLLAHFLMLTRWKGWLAGELRCFEVAATAVSMPEGQGGTYDAAQGRGIFPALSALCLQNTDS